MTHQQFIQLSEDFACYARCEVSYKEYVPYLNKYTQATGMLMGIGQSANKHNLIISRSGHSYAIHYTKVKFPFE